MRNGRLTVPVWIVLIASILPIPVIWIAVHVIKNAVAAYALYHYICLLPVIIWGFDTWRGKVKLLSTKQIVILILLAVASAAGAIIAYLHFGDTVLSSERAMDLLVQFGYSKELVVPISIYIVLFNPVLEELFWRGVILEVSDEAKTHFKHFGLLWSSIFYGALHYPILQRVLYPGWAEFGTLVISCFGAFFAVVCRKTNSVVLPILLHGIIDLAFFCMMFTMFKRLRVPGW